MDKVKVCKVCSREFNNVTLRYIKSPETGEYETTEDYCDYPCALGHHVAEAGKIKRTNSKLALELEFVKEEVEKIAKEAKESATKARGAIKKSDSGVDVNEMCVDVE
jgi:hypothetical protein